MKVFLNWLDTILSALCVGLIRIYQMTLSPDRGLFSLWLKGRVCAHEPHCSAYGVQVFQRYGFIRGARLTMKRVVSCTPSRHITYDPPFFRVVFFSSAPIGVPFLEQLASDNRFDLVGVVTAPDKPAGRGLAVQANVIKQKAHEVISTETKGNGEISTKRFLSTSQAGDSADSSTSVGMTLTRHFGRGDDRIATPMKINPDKSEEGKEFYEWLKAKKPDYLVVIAYGKIIPQAILDCAAIAPINVHGSLLPKYRGASPIQTALLEGEKESGITIMRMDAGLDTGDMIRMLRIPLLLDRTSKELIGAMMDQGPAFLADTLEGFAHGEYKAKPQNDAQATHTTKIAKEDGQIDPWREPLSAVYAKYRAYALWPKTFFQLDQSAGGVGTRLASSGGIRVIVEEMKVDEAIYNKHMDQPMLSAEGQLNPAIRSLLVKPEGKKAMDFTSFANGYPDGIKK